MTDRELMQQALDLLDDINQCSLPPTGIPLPAEIDHVMEALRARLAQPEQEPVAWLITDEKINSLQVDSIQYLIDRARHAHMTDIKLRINGQDEWYQADWLKHLTRTAPPQREWQGLTDEEIIDALNADEGDAMKIARAIEAKLKEKNA